MIAFVTGLRAEARLAGVDAFPGGGDTEGATRAASAALAAGAQAFISFGLAGGLSPDARAGTLVIPRVVRVGGGGLATDVALSEALGGFTCDVLLAGERAVAGRAEKARLWQETGADAVDLESGAVARTAAAACVPFAVLRVVCDPAWRDLPPAALVALDGSGAIGLGRVLASLARQPSQLGRLLALARDATRARRALRQRIATLRRSHALQPWA